MSGFRDILTSVANFRTRELNRLPDVVRLGLKLPAAYPLTAKPEDISPAGIEFMRRAWPKLLETPYDQAAWEHYADGRGEKTSLALIYSTLPEHRDRDKHILSKESGGNLTFYDPGNPLVELHRMLTGQDEPQPPENA